MNINFMKYRLEKIQNQWLDRGKGRERKDDICWYLASNELGNGTGI